MKRYVRFFIISNLLIFAFFCSYNLRFSDGRQKNISVNAFVYNSDIKTIIENEERSFIASACDAICPDAPYLCKVAFCSVILNRCADPAFPNTPAEVVYQDSMFMRAFDNEFVQRPSETSLKAYDDAYNGFSPCPDALYYSTTDSSDITLKKRKTILQIGRYIFS